MENSISGLGSFVLHVLVLLILALVYRGGDGEFEGETYEVFIGDLDNVELSENQDEEIEEKNEVTQVSDESFDEPVEDIVPPGVTDTDVSDTVDDISFSASAALHSPFSSSRCQPRVLLQAEKISKVLSGV